MKKKIGKWFTVILMLYVVMGVLLYFFQNKLLLHPEPLPQDHAYTFNMPFEEKKVLYDSSTLFDIVCFKPSKDSLKRGAVIYFHGNMNNIEYYAHFAKNFTKHGYEVWMMDYPGYGKSTGAINEALLYTEADEVYKMVSAAKFPADSIIIYGKSLGTGIATQLASRRNCKKLILESPYYSIPEVAEHYAWMYPVEWMSEFKIPTHEYIQKVVAPVTIFHGTEDATIPHSNTEKLKPFLKPIDEVISIEGGGHNDLNDFPLMKKKLDSLLKL
ncbi:alpha/beta fold hydrolase [soil metagenome]